MWGSVLCTSRRHAGLQLIWGTPDGRERSVTSVVYLKSFHGKPSCPAPCAEIDHVQQVVLPRRSLGDLVDRVPLHHLAGHHPLPVPVLGRTRAPWASNRARTIARDLPAAWRGPDCLPSWRMARAAAVPGGQRAMGEAGGRQLSGNLAAGADSWRPERDTCRSGRLRVRGSRVVFPWEHDGGLKRLDAGRNGSIRAETVGVCAGRRITAGQGVEWGPVQRGSQ